MRAVNLLPKDLRSAGSGGGSGSPVGPIALIAVLALAVLLVGTWAFTARQVEDREADAARLNAEAQAAEAQAADLSGFQALVTAADTRRSAVVGTIKGRVAWADVLEEISRTVPDGTTLDSMKATTAASVAVEGGTSNPMRASLDAPAVEIAGCAPSQAGVAKLISRLRSMKDVEKVSISSSEKTGGAEGGAAPSGDTNVDCTYGSAERPQFAIVVFLKKPEAAATAATTGTTTPAATTTTTTTGSGQ